ncbi:MAG: hypothetical protein K9M49_07930, partial [Candidatus Marinimicrobia bacterium]|nr:hypothetical protein [Candidatus Neomarinimicrobiota bacterium]
MRKNLTITLAGIALVSIVQAETLALDLNKAIDMALESNIQIQNVEENLIKAKAQKKEAFSSALPVVSAFGQASHSFSIASQPISFPIPFGVLDANGDPIALGSQNTDPNGNPIPGEFLQKTGIMLVPFDLAFG